MRAAGVARLGRPAGITLVGAWSPAGQIDFLIVLVVQCQLVGAKTPTERTARTLLQGPSKHAPDELRVELQGQQDEEDLSHSEDLSVPPVNSLFERRGSSGLIRSIVRED